MRHEHRKRLERLERDRGAPRLLFVTYDGPADTTEPHVALREGETPSEAAARYAADHPEYENATILPVFGFELHALVKGG